MWVSGPPDDIENESGETCEEVVDSIRTGLGLEVDSGNGSLVSRCVERVISVRVSFVERVPFSRVAVDVGDVTQNHGLRVGLEA